MRFKVIVPTMIKDFKVFDWFLDQYGLDYVRKYRENHYCQDQHWSQLMEFQVEEDLNIPHSLLSEISLSSNLLLFT